MRWDTKSAFRRSNDRSERTEPRPVTSPLGPYGDRVLVTSRSFEEYVAFFDLDDEALGGRILDCAAGASGFAATLAARGGQVTAVDSAYTDAPVLLEQAALARADGDAMIDSNDHRFVWDWYGCHEHRRTLRASALDAFTADFARSPGRYLPGRLAELPFIDGTFDLALCSHLLFTWSDVLDEQWHERALRELLRVATEVRVFPLVLKGTGAPVSFLPALVDALRGEGHTVDVVPVPYEFQVDTHDMLRLRRRRARWPVRSDPHRRRPKRRREDSEGDPRRADRGGPAGPVGRDVHRAH